MAQDHEPALNKEASTQALERVRSLGAAGSSPTLRTSWYTPREAIHVGMLIAVAMP
jgi:hypothetical protein